MGSSTLDDAAADYREGQIMLKEILKLLSDDDNSVPAYDLARIMHAAVIPLMEGYSRVQVLGAIAMLIANYAHNTEKQDEIEAAEGDGEDIITRARPLIFAISGLIVQMHRNMRERMDDKGETKYDA